MGIETEHAELIAHIEAAGRQPLFWNEALKALSRRVGDAAIGLILEYPDGVGPEFGSAIHFDGPKMIEWGQRFYDADPWTQAGCYPDPGEVLFCPTPPEQIEKTDYYREWMKPQGFRPDAMIVGCLGGTPRQHSQSLGFYSRHEGRTLDETDRQFIVELFPHLQQAAAVSRCVLGLDIAGKVYAETLSLVRIPILHLNAGGRICWSNAEMDKMLRTGHGPVRRNGRIVMPTSISESRYSELLIALSDDSAGGRQEELLVPNRLGGMPFKLTICRAQSSRNTLPTEARYIVFASTRNLNIEGDEGLLVRNYNLTPSEARLTLELLAGATTKEAATNLVLTEDTVRQYLKRIFAKTGTKNQADLLRSLTRDVMSSPLGD